MSKYAANACGSYGLAVRDLMNIPQSAVHSLGRCPGAIFGRVYAASSESPKTTTPGSADKRKFVNRPSLDGRLLYSTKLLLRQSDRADGMVKGIGGTA
jgi:hypothetical protein